MKKQTAPALLVIFGGDVLQMLHFPVTLYPTLSLLNLSALKPWWGVSPHVSLIRSGKDLVDVGGTAKKKRKASECAYVDFVCAACFALLNWCAHHAAGPAL